MVATIQQFQAFLKNFQKLQKNPRDVVQELLNSGQMSSEQYADLSAQVNKILGKNPNTFLR